MKEVEGLVNYNKLKRMRQYQNACRVLSGDVDGDSVVIVKGDGKICRFVDCYEVGRLMVSSIRSRSISSHC